MKGGDAALVAGAAVCLGALVYAGRARAMPAPGGLSEPAVGEGFSLPAPGPDAPSERLLAFLRSREGFRALPYRDGPGISIGYGHRIKPGELLEVVSVEEAERMLRADAAAALAVVDREVDRLILPHERDALASFVYNVGEMAFRKSTLLARFNDIDDAGAAAEFARWIYTRDAQGNKVQSAGLVARRAAERALFEGRSG